MAENNNIKMQEDLANTISRGLVNFKKSPKDRITLSYIETRLESLDFQWTTFQNTHHKIVCEMKQADYAETNYSIANVYESTEEEYFLYKSMLKENMYKLKPKNEQQTKTNSENTKRMSVKLPEIVLPNFSGNYSDWANYKDMFKSIIDRNDSLDDVRKLHYLKGSLVGEAAALVRNIAITADNYQICWNRLVSRYENKRSMANSIIKRMMTQKNLSHESAVSLRCLLDTTSECLQALRNLGVNTSSWDFILIYTMSQKLDPQSRAKWEAKMSESDHDLPQYREFEEFLETRFRSLEYKLTEKDNTHTTKHSHTVTAVEPVCSFCSETHKLNNCKKFLRENIDARRQFVQNNHLCYNCLSSGHSVYGCTVSTTCRLCKKRHHTLLHPKTPPVGKPGPSHEPSKFVAVVSTPKELVEAEEVESSRIVTSCFSTSRSTVLLATALVNVSAQTNDSSGSVLRSLLDQGSQASFITESAAQLLGLKRVKETVSVSGVGSSGSINSSSSVNLLITSRNDPSFSLCVKAHVLEKITSVMPSSKIVVDPSQITALPTLKLADPTFNQPGCIDLLLGAEVYGKIMMTGLIHCGNGSLLAQQTRLGWILSGVVEKDTSTTQIASQLKCNSVTLNEVNDDLLLKRFWEMESEPVTSKGILTVEENLCEELFSKTTKRDEFGRYVVKLPFKNTDPACKYSGSQDIARKRFLYLEKRLLNNPTLKVEYSKVINEYLAMGHMETCVDKSKTDAVYLPHHAVVREDKDSTKVRVVFDASCKGTNGASLNSDLMIGPRIQPKLRHLVMRWRCYPISLVADIVKMYRQTKVTDEDADFQRILWRDNPGEDLKHFRLLRVTFGTSAAPHLAVRALQQVAHDEGDEFPLAADRVLNDFYVDDLMTGCHSVAEGVQVVEQMTKMLDRGGFPIHKWSSNSEELLKLINNVSNSDQNMNLKTDEVMKILGLTWNRETDDFRFKVNLHPQSGLVTKRKVISDIAKLFDPIVSWLAPAIVSAKIFIQRLWLLGIGWDDPLPSGLLQDWLSFRNDLIHLEKFIIPRWIKVNRDDQCLELHGFSDASNAAFAAVVYARLIDKDKNIHVSLVTSKTRVAPIKQVSIPRLELCGASLLAKLLSEVAALLNVEKSNVHAWTDSTIVLAWLSSHPSRRKTLVANRVSDILTSMDGNQWSHVRSQDNPADCASRGLPPAECAENLLWKQGPRWLHNIQINYAKGEVIGTKLEVEKYPGTDRITRVVAVSSCIWASYFQIGLFYGACPVLVAQLRRHDQPLGNGTVIDDEAASWISSTGNFSAIPCVLLFGLMGECLGRKLPYLVICVATCASFLLFYCSSSFNMLILAQILQGPLLGGSTNVCLMIASECVSPKHRGVFLTIKSATAFWAMWLANAIGTFFHWKNIGIIGMACAAYNTLMMTICPESPFWLASKGKIIKCRAAHRWLRGTDESAERELECLIKCQIERSRKEEGGSVFTRLPFYFKKVLTVEFYQPLGLCILLSITYQFSGKLVISMYAIDIIKKITDNESVAYTGMLILDGITVLGMYVGCVVSRYTKRRSLFFSTEFLAILFLFLLSFYLYMIKLGLIKENVYLSISLLLAFSLSISCGPMILITSLISEILPLDLRTLAAILQCITSNTVGAVSFKIAPWMFTKFGTHGAFLYFAVGSLVCSVILLKYLPETRNKTLEEIEITFKEKNKSKDTKELL